MLICTHRPTLPQAGDLEEERRARRQETRATRVDETRLHSRRIPSSHINNSQDIGSHRASAGSE